MRNPAFATADFKLVRHTFNVVGSEPILVAKSDPARVWLMFAAQSGSVIILAPDSDFDSPGTGESPKGITLTAQPPIKFTLGDDGPACQSEWYAWDSTTVPQSPGTTHLFVYEITKIRPDKC